MSIYLIINKEEIWVLELAVSSGIYSSTWSNRVYIDLAAILSLLLTNFWQKCMVCGRKTRKGEMKEDFPGRLSN